MLLLLVSVHHTHSSPYNSSPPALIPRSSLTKSISAAKPLKQCANRTLKPMLKTQWRATYENTSKTEAINPATEN